MPKDLKGKQFGQLTAISYVIGGKWICKCECGRLTQVVTSKLTCGHTQTCGTHKRGKIQTTSTMPDDIKSIYRRWTSMRARCNNPSDSAYQNYGGRGIKVDPSWDDFYVFLQDVGIPPKLSMQLDRKNNDKGYTPDNTRWISQQKNLNNKRNNVKIEFNGENLTIAEWAKKLDMNYRTLNNRINRGWEVSRALTTPSNASWTKS